MNALTALQQAFGSADWSRWQVSRWCFYDYVRLAAAGANQIQFFANPLGSNDPVAAAAKTKEQTNLTKQRSFGQNWFIIVQIRTEVHLLPKARNVSTMAGGVEAFIGTAYWQSEWLYNFLQQGVLNISIGQKDYMDIDQPFLFCPPGFGWKALRTPKQFNAGDTVTGAEPNINVAQNSLARNVYTVEPVQLIEPEQTFDATIDFPNANYPALTSMFNDDGGTPVTPLVNVGLIFDGYIARAVQ